MSSQLDAIVQVTITQQTQAVQQASFSIPLIIGTSNRFVDLIRYYTGTAGMLSDGFLITDPEYIYASKAFSQAISPKQVGIGKYTNSGSLVTDIQAIQGVSDLWYGLSVTSNLAADIEAVAAYIETQLKVFVGASSDAAIITSSSVDVASVLKGLAYKRSALLYSAQANKGPDAAWLGGQLPQVPGASTWKFKQLVGITPDIFTATQRNYAIGVPGTPGKNCNIYETVGGVGITEEGTMAGGQFIDLTVGIDWLTSTMKTNVFSLLVNALKIPYTDQGAAIIQNGVFQTLRQGVANGLIDGSSPITVTVPSVLSVSTTLRAERVLPNVNFSCRLAGALHFVQINGTVTV